MTYDECPNCGHVPTPGLTVSHMSIRRCNKCDKEFCHHCDGSNGGRQCPACGSTDLDKVGKVYTR